MIYILIYILLGIAFAIIAFLRNETGSSIIGIIFTAAAWPAYVLHLIGELHSFIFKSVRITKG